MRVPTTAERKCNLVQQKSPESTEKFHQFVRFCVLPSLRVRVAEPPQVAPLDDTEGQRLSSEPLPDVRAPPHLDRAAWALGQ